VTEKEVTEVSFDETSHAWFDRNRLSDLPALLIGVYTHKVHLHETEEHVEELALLAETHGIAVEEKVITPLRTCCAATFLSQGKLEEMDVLRKEKGIKLIIFDDEISPAQQRNLESFFKIPVIDRTVVILGVFADRAKSKEAKLQIELAKTRYLVPRLKHRWSHFSKQTGGGGGASGGGYLKGEGERQIEIDKRLLKKRESQLRHEIASIKNYRETQRGLRERRGVPVFAIVGYTNAGKSTLMHAITGADVLVEDKLFATLDTTTRQFHLPFSHQEILCVDTVGFVRKLPHLLVVAFRSTLEEAAQADVLIHMIDASHPMALEQAETTLQVLEELGAGDMPMITCFNKMDLENSDPEVFTKLKFTYPRAVSMSALQNEGVDALFDEMEWVLKSWRKIMRVKIPQSEYHLVSQAMREGRIIEQEYVNNDILLEVELPVQISFSYEKYLVE